MKIAMSDQKRISREQGVEDLQRRSGGREVGYLRHAERLVKSGWSERDAGRYAQLYMLWLEASRSPEAKLHPKEQQEARQLEQDHGVGPDFAILRAPQAQP